MSAKLAPLPCVSILFFLLAIFLVWSAADTVHWRDSAEFVLGATHLDIAHPPGFVTYSAFANLFSLLPFGPLTWRVHLFSCFVTVLCFGLVLHILNLLTLKFQISRVGRWLVCTAIIVPLLLSPAFMRQATLAEAYQLNAFFVLLIIWCGVHFELTRDVRYLFLGGFGAGLGLGNHPSFLLFVLPAFLLFVPYLTLRVTWIAIALTTFGLSCLLYLPLRAVNAPPLNTGAPITAERMWNLLSDARDRHLRPAAIFAVGNMQEQDLGYQLEVSRKDGEKVLRETGGYLAPLAVFGVLALFLTGYGRIGGLVSLPIAIFLLFFRGWQPDPFVPVFLCFSIAGGVSLARILAGRGFAWQTGVGMLFLFFWFLQWEENKSELIAQRSHALPHETGLALLTSLPPHAVFVAESSWYLARHLQFVEGVRRDIAIQYEPRFLFPYYFEPVHLQVGESEYRAIQGEELRVPGRGVFGEFLSQATKVADVFLEPTAATSGMFLQAARVTESGLLQIGEPEEEHVIPSALLHLGEQLRELPSSYLRRDGANYLETRTLPLTDYLLARTKSPELSIQGLQGVCGPVGEKVCSYAMYLKQVEYALRGGAPELATHLFHEIFKAYGETPLALELTRAYPFLRDN